MDTETHYLLGKKRLQVVDKYNLEKANPDDTVMVAGKSEFVVEVMDSDKIVSIIPLS